MRLLVPATPDGLHASTVRSILRQGYTCAVVPMTQTESYFRLLEVAWAARETFAIVEHDIELRGGELAELDRCPELWCAHSYEVFAGDVATAYGGPYALGCVRFRAQLLEELPDALEVAGGDNTHPVHPDRSYLVMDSTLTGYLRRAGYEAHLHTPAVIHHHQYLREGAFLG